MVTSSRFCLNLTAVSSLVIFTESPLNKFSLSGIGYLQHCSWCQSSDSREAICISNQTPEVRISIFLVGNPCQGIPFVDHPDTFSTYTTRCWICRWVCAFRLDLQKGDIKRGTHWCTIWQKERQTLTE